MKKKTNNFKKKYLILSIILILILIVILLLIYKNVNNTNSLSSELQRYQSYTQVTDGDEDIEETDNVKFDAFFLEDLDSDGIAEGVRGTCNEIGTSKTLYMELEVIEEGYVKDGVISIGSENFYFKTTLVADNEISQNYVSTNTSSIEFNDISCGIEKTIIGSVRSGDYSSTSTITSALDKNINNYSRDDNFITFSGIYVDDDGNETSFSKTVYLTVDWYGEVNCNITSQSQNQNIKLSSFDSLLSDEEITLTFSITVTETENELLMYGSYIYGIIPEFNGYSATSCTITGTNVTYTYDEETNEFTAQREAVTDEDGNITTNGYSSKIKATSYNIFNFTITYPIDAYFVFGDVTSFDYAITINALNKGYNNPNEEFDNPYISDTKTAIVTIRYDIAPDDVYNIYCWVGDYSSTYADYVVSKEKPLNLYNELSEEETEDYYKVHWEVITTCDTNGYTLEETKEDYFRTSSGTYISMEDILSTVGIYFSGASSVLADDGWIKIYDADTNNLLVTFTSDTWGNYSSSNPYYYDTAVKHIRVETSETSAGTFHVYNIKEIDDEYLTENYTIDEFDVLSYIYTYFSANFTCVSGSIETEVSISKSNNALYVSKVTKATISIDEDFISTAKTAENEIITIKTLSSSTYVSGWTNGEFLIKLPEEIISVEINSVSINNSNVSIAAYDVFEEDGSYFIEILTSNTVWVNDESEEDYTITIDCNLTPDPRTAETTSYVKLYAINQVGSEYMVSASDIYDLDGDENVDEKVNYSSCTLDLEPSSTLTTLQFVSDYNDEGTTTISPNVAVVENTNRTATITLSITNNYSYDTLDFSILGVIPFEGNSYILTNTDLKSEFTTYLTGEITVPDELEEYVTIYYSTLDTPTDDIEDTSNNWVLAEDIKDWSLVKTYLILIDSSYIFQTGETIEFSYEITIPKGIEYNTTTYSAFEVDFALDTEDGLYYTNTSPDKVGIMYAKYYDLNLVKYQQDTTKTLEGVMFTLQEVGESTSKIGTTDEDGIISFTDLYAEKYYCLKEYSTIDDYVLNEEKIYFYTYITEDDDGNEILNLAYVDDDGEYQDLTDIYSWIRSSSVTQADSSTETNYSITLEIDNEEEAELKIIKQDEDGNVLKNVKFTLVGNNKTKIISTSSEGIGTATSLLLDTQYTLTETKATGYYIPDTSITFTISKEDGEYVLTYEDNGTILSFEVEVEDEIPTIVLTIQNEEIPTYSLKIVKYAVDSDTVLENAQFKIYGDGISSSGKTYTTGEDGTVTIDGIYQYVDGKYITGEYNISEIYAPSGYALNSTTLSFKGYRDDDGNLQIEVLDGSSLIRTLETEDGEEYLDIEINQDTFTITIGIEDEEIFTLTKIDGDTQEVIEGAKFKILDTDGNYVTGSDGEIVGTLETIDGEEMYVVTTDELRRTFSKFSRRIIYGN